jgi:hypothetical protein
MQKVYRARHEDPPFTMAPLTMTEANGLLTQKDAKRGMLAIASMNRRAAICTSIMPAKALRYAYHRFPPPQGRHCGLDFKRFNWCSDFFTRFSAGTTPQISGRANTLNKSCTTPRSAGELLACLRIVATVEHASASARRLGGHGRPEKPLTMTENGQELQRLVLYAFPC